MDTEPASGPARDEDPVPGSDGPGRVTPDWMDEAEWKRYCAAGDEDPPGEDEELCPEDGPLTEAPLEVITEQARADGAEHEALMARLIAAGLDGYAHRRGAPPVPGVFSGPVAGFGQGLCLDAALPSSTLSGIADDASGPDRTFAGVTDDELMGLVGTRQRLQARQAWELLMTVAEFIRRRPGPGCALEGPGRMPRVWHEHAASELATQLHITAGAADDLLDLAHDLTVKLPLTAAALRDGIIDLDKARIVALRCSALTPDEARAAEAILFGEPDVDEMTWGMIRDRIARAAIEINPEAAVKRREQAAKQRRVEVLPEDSGNEMIAGRELPPAAVLAASQLLTARARQLRKAGIAGGMDELRVQAYLEKLGVLDPLAAIRQGPDSTPDNGTADGGGNGGPGPGGTHPGHPAHPGPAGGAGAMPGEVPAGFAARTNLTLPLATLLDLAERPGFMPGIGAIDPALVQDLAAAASRNPRSTWCLTTTDPEGRPIAHGCGRPPPKRGRPDHGGHQGPAFFTSADRGPPGTGTLRLNPATFARNADDGAAQGRDLEFVLEPLAGPCDHRHQAAGHDPGAMLRHLTGILNACCTFPPCRRPEAQCDYEHSVPFEAGGRTCLCEAGPVCRHNHRDKQAPGWHLEPAGSRGWFRWTTPSGRSYLSGPTRYPS
jgi:hypothetical protein